MKTIHPALKMSFYYSISAQIGIFFLSGNVEEKKA